MPGKIKLLLVGPVLGNIQVLVDKLKSLQASKAGPFDICFCVGSSFQSSDDSNNSEAGGVSESDPESPSTSSLLKAIEELPMPVYLQNYTAGSIKGIGVSDDDGEDNTQDDIVQLSKNLYHLRGNDGDNEKNARSRIPMANVFKIPVQNFQDPLIVACCPPHVRFDSPQCKPLLEKSKAFTEGCDLLLTDEWPQGMEDVLQVDAEVANVSFDVSQIVLACRPRYHIASSSSATTNNSGEGTAATKQYHASPAYQIPGTPHHGRFISLAPVIVGKTSKSNKFIHALGLVPILGRPEPPPVTAAALPCPFGAPNQGNFNRGVPPPPPRPPPPPPPSWQLSSQGSSFSRFDTGGRKRQRNDNDSGDKQQDGASMEPPDDPNISSLFLYGLHKDVSGQLQSTSSPVVLQAFKKYNIKQVRHPPTATTSTYCFLEFPTQQDAFACLLDCQGRITIQGVDLTLKWATGSNNKRPRQSSLQQQQQPERHYVTHAEAAQSTTLYFHPPKNQGNDSEENEDSKDGERGTNAMKESFAEEVRKLMEQTLEDAMNEGGDADDSERITAETEPALAVSVRTITEKSFGFLEFASHAAATMALAALTKSTDGGAIRVDDEKKNEEDAKGKIPSHILGTVVRWAKRGESTNKQKNNKGPRTKETEFLEALGLERKHFPADSRTDCWFCLASPTCEKHLITTIHDECYTTMPKGPMHPGHLLIVPVAHSSQGVWTLGGSVCQEVMEIKNQLLEHANREYGMDLFVFERAIQTRGGYHTHVQCVPIPKGKIAHLQTTMMAHAKASGFNLRTIESDLGITSLLSKENNEDEQDYFYAELATQQQVYRFVYKKSSTADEESSGGGGGKVPLQFGREVVASILNQPELAHWKSCVVDKDQETELAANFRKSFQGE